MSPAFQGNLEVERYIGSCLISSSVRVNNTGVKTNPGNHNNVNYKGKKVADCGGTRVGKQHTRVLNHRTSGGSCQDHFGAAGYPSPGSLLPLCECGGLKFGGARYGSPGPATGVGGNWAGLPLISMAPSNSRRNRKNSTSSNGSVSNGNRNSKNVSSGSQPTTVVASANCGKNGTAEVDSGSQQSRTPLSRLAIHTQGAPLILSGRYAVNGRKSNVNQGRAPPLRQFRDGDVGVRRSNSVRDTRDTGSSGNSANGISSNTRSSDCLSVASDESSGHSENSLPRIIKPRKRRKKDRKPPPSATTSASDIPTSSTPNELKNSAVESPSIVTLKPYIPLCYEWYGSRHWVGNRLSLTEQDPEGRTVEKRHAFNPSNGNDNQVDDEHVSQTCEDDNQEPNLHHNFDDVQEDEEGSHVDSGALFPYPFPPTLCQCRYCDPSGLIWDVDQHCYSPFLTPPSPTSDNKSTSYSKSPFENIPLFLTPPPTEVRGFDFFNKDQRSTPSSSVFLSENDHSSVVRRSWSEPLPSSLDNEGSRGSFGIIGHGRVCGDENVTESRMKKYEFQNASAELPASTVPLSTSQSLEVSTEIVTSPNGHRDIEIKFYSTSPPAVSTIVPTGLVKGSCDLCVCDESSVKGGKTSFSFPAEDVGPQDAINVRENTQQESGESSVNEHAGNAKEHASVICKEGGVHLDSGDNVFAADVKTRDEKEGCNISESAKRLGEEVDQLCLHAEE